MDANKVLKYLVSSSGMSRAAISRKMGKNDNYISVRLQTGRRNLPRIDTMSTVADACGYDLLLRNREDGTEIIIDPPKRE